MGRSHHDIPPAIAIDVGSFSIETKSKPVFNNGHYLYKDERNNIYMVLIKIIRKDDGAILYQNFGAHDAKIEFTDLENRRIAIESVNGSHGKKVIKVESPHLPLSYMTIPPIDVVNGREHKLHNSYKIKKVIVQTKEGDILFSHATSMPSTPSPTSPVSASPEYTDNKYRVFIQTETA